MDTMTYLVHKVTELPKNKIIGMGGALDSARFKFRLAEAMELSYIRYRWISYWRTFRYWYDSFNSVSYKK